MNIWHDMNPKEITPTDFSAVIEISKGSRCKYELDKHTGLLRLDRVLYTSTHYPASYGFIPRTFADDGDPLDVLVLCNEPIQPLTLVRVYPIGVMRMLDDGHIDDKIIAVPLPIPIITDITTSISCLHTCLMKLCTFSRCISSWKTSRPISRSSIAARRPKRSFARPLTAT